MTDDRDEVQKLRDNLAAARRPILDLPMPSGYRDVRQSVVEEALHSAERRIEDLEKENKRLRLKVAIDQRIREMEAELAMLKIERKSMEEG